MRTLLALAASVSIGCGQAGYEVVRVHAGRARAGRFVNSTAYAASLEAAMAEERGDWQRAAELLVRARDEDPDAPDLPARLGIALCHLGKTSAAMFAFQDSLRIDPDHERAFTGRALCRLKTAKTEAELIEARKDLSRALIADGDAIEPTLALAMLDTRAGKLVAARARLEEAAVMHPSSASVFRALAEVAARQGDAARATSAALAATAFDDVEGKRARESAMAQVDLGGVALWSLKLRKSFTQPTAVAPLDAACAKQRAALEAIATKGSADEIAVAAEGVRAACPELEGFAMMIEVAATWSPEKAIEVEGRALSAPSSEARRWGVRARLRRFETEELLDPEALPRADDRLTLALSLAAAAVVESKKGNGANADGLARVAFDLAPSEPTVARLTAEVARRAGRSTSDPWRVRACALARTTVEKKACALP